MANTFAITFNQSRGGLELHPDLGQHDRLPPELHQGPEREHHHLWLQPAGTELTSVTDTEGRTVTISYNGENLVSSVTDSTGRQVSYTYANPAPGVYRLQTASYGGDTTTYGYDGNGNLNEITDPAGNITTMTYDSTERVTSVTRVTNDQSLTGDVTHYSYTSGSAGSPNSGMTTVTDPDGNATTYHYDPSDRVTSVTDALGHTESATYNPESSPMALTNGLTQVTTLAYDTNNNLDAITAPKTSSGQNPATTTFAFNTPSGVNGGTYLPSSSVDPQSNCSSFTYDAAGNETASYQGFTPNTNCDGMTQGQGVTSVKDAYQGDPGVPSCGGKPGELCTTTSGAGNVTSYAYDSAGELSSVIQPNGSCASGSRTLCTTITDDALESTADRHRREGPADDLLLRRLEPDHRDPLRRHTACHPSTGKCITFTYDQDGNVRSRVDSTGTTTFTYDTLNRLTEESLPNGTDACPGSNPAGITTTYDAASNMTQYCDAGGPVTYHYNADNLNDGIATGTGANCTPGHVVQPCTSYTYNANNELTNITYPQGTGVTDALGYDGAGP